MQRFGSAFHQQSGLKIQKPFRICTKFGSIIFQKIFWIYISHERLNYEVKKLLPSNISWWWRFDPLGTFINSILISSIFQLWEPNSAMLLPIKLAVQMSVSDIFHILFFRCKLLFWPKFPTHWTEVSAMHFKWREYVSQVRPL